MPDELRIRKDIKAQHVNVSDRFFGGGNLGLGGTLQVNNITINENLFEGFLQTEVAGVTTYQLTEQELIDGLINVNTTQNAVELTLPPVSELVSIIPGDGVNKFFKLVIRNAGTNIITLKSPDTSTGWTVHIAANIPASIVTTFFIYVTDTTSNEEKARIIQVGNSTNPSS